MTTRTATSKMFATGDHVCYKHNVSKVWRGPGVILGVDSNLDLVPHGGSHLRASPCHPFKVKDDSQIVTTPVKPSLMKDCNKYECSQNKKFDSSTDIVVPVDADKPINADNPQEVTPNDGEILNDHHSTEAESVEMNVDTKV